jgi:hypothetical protein
MAEAEAPTDERTAARRAGEPENWDGKAVNEWMSTPHGRHLMERFLDHCGAGQRLYHFDNDALGAMWRDGLADAGRFWEALLQHHCPDLFLRMINERRSRAVAAQKAIDRKELRRDPKEAPVTKTAIEELADEQAETAAAEERQRKADERAARRKPSRKKD